MVTVSTQPILYNSACHRFPHCCVFREYKFPVTVRLESQTETRTKFAQTVVHMSNTHLCVLLYSANITSEISSALMQQMFCSLGCVGVELSIIIWHVPVHVRWEHGANKINKKW